MHLLVILTVGNGMNLAHVYYTAHLTALLTLSKLKQHTHTCAGQIKKSVQNIKCLGGGNSGGLVGLWSGAVPKPPLHT